MEFLLTPSRLWTCRLSARWPHFTYSRGCGDARTGQQALGWCLSTVHDCEHYPQCLCNQAQSRAAWVKTSGEGGLSGVCVSSQECVSSGGGAGGVAVAGWQGGTAGQVWRHEFCSFPNPLRSSLSRTFCPRLTYPPCLSVNEPRCLLQARGREWERMWRSAYWWEQLISHHCCANGDSLAWAFKYKWTST